MTSRRLFAPGPFRADQLRTGDEYELSDGHAIHVAPAGGRHGAATVAATLIIQSDPLVEHAGVDVGYSPEPGTLRAPDVSVMPSAPAPGWAPGVPPLAIEYADRHQDEDDLRVKIQDLLGRGTKLMWVVRLEGIRRVEVHSPEGTRVRWGGGGGARGVEDEVHGPHRDPVPVPQRPGGPDLLAVHGAGVPLAAVLQHDAAGGAPDLRLVLGDRGVGEVEVAAGCAPDPQVPVGEVDALARPGAVEDPQTPARTHAVSLDWGRSPPPVPCRRPPGR